MHRLYRYQFSRVQCNIVLCMAIVGGVAIAYTGTFRVNIFCLVGIVLLPLAYCRRSLVSIVCLMLIGLSIGLMRGQGFNQQRLTLQQYFDQRQTIHAVALTDSVYDAHGQVSFTASQIVIDGKSFAGQVQLGGFGINTVLAGDTVSATGKIRAGFGSSQISMGFAQIQVLTHHNTPIASLRRSFDAGIQSALPEPAASLGLGILIGQRSTLPKVVKNDLLAIGLTHIIAVSGYNLTIIIQSFRRSFKGLSKRSITYLSFVIIAVFLLITGSSASIVRAAIVSVLSIAAAYYGRTIHPFLLVMLAAASTGFMNPYYVWGDASWYLSMLAFFGILVLAPLVVERWQVHGFILLLLVETISAELMTIPYILLTFSQISLLGLLANTVIVPLVPLAMLCSFVAGLAGMLVAPVAGWITWPARICLTYIIDAAHLMARVPHTFLQHIQISLIGALSMYAVIIGVIVSLHYKTKHIKDAKITDIDLSQPTILAEETT